MITKDTIDKILSRDMSFEKIIAMSNDRGFINHRGNIIADGLFVISEIKQTGKYKLHIMSYDYFQIFPKSVENNQDYIIFETLEEAMDAGWVVND
jgi:hypothetical protein